MLKVDTTDTTRRTLDSGTGAVKMKGNTLVTGTKTFTIGSGEVLLKGDIIGIILCGCYW